MSKDLIDEIISSIGKAGEIGHKFFKLIILSTSGADETYNNVDDIPNSLSYIKFADQIDVYFA